MSFDPIQLIRTRSREQWQRWATDIYEKLRGWIRDNGEKASVVAFALGIALVLFYKVIIGAFAVAVIAAFLGWNIALPEAEQPRATGSATGSESDPTNPL